MRFRPLLAAAAAAGLLAAGCDYWRNLVDDRSIATAHLKIKVQDAYTLELLGATCTDAERGLELKTIDGDGQDEALGAGTGPYTINCQAQWGYYDKSVGFSLTPAGKTVVVGMARLGGEETWYKDDTLREVRIREKFDTILFPRALAFNAYPDDRDTSLKRFRYTWTFAKAKDLDQNNYSRMAVYPFFSKSAELVNPAPGPDTLTLSVWSMMRDGVPYPIGVYARPFVWVRNQIPRLVMNKLDSGRQYPVGCPGTYLPLQINFQGVDPEGACKSVRFFTEGTGSSFGPVDTTLPCFKQTIKFDLRNIFDSLKSDIAILSENTLKIAVTDNNGESFDTSITIITRSNILPSVTSSIENSQTSAFTGDSIKVYFELNDEDGSPQTATINWAGVDGETRMDYRQRTGHTLRDSATWTYRTPGWQYFSITVSDFCGETVISKTDSIFMRDNRNPAVKLKYSRDEGTPQDHLYVFQLIAEDDDIRERLNDRITEVHVDWGEGSQSLDPAGITSITGKTLKHHFTHPPDSLGRYRIKIQVHDAHDGVGTLDTLILIR